jgi:hypothetical protein
MQVQDPDPKPKSTPTPPPKKPEPGAIATGKIRKKVYYTDNLGEMQPP